MKAERIPFYGPQPVPAPIQISPELQALYDERSKATKRWHLACEELGRAENELYSIKEMIREKATLNTEDT